MEPSSAEAADEFVREVGRESGWMSQDEEAHVQQTIPALWKSITGLRKIACDSTEALSRSLYSKETRFIYELIQNADDNDYSIAEEEGDPPFLRFKVTEDSIVLESNENGFSAGNVRAICCVGASTKDGVKGYIGEKGIGFKSVFVVSRRVHVESGYFSFAFDYDKSKPDSGLGMVTPLVEEHSSLPSGVRSRITLHLKPERRGLFEDFEQLPDTLLLFLQRLKRLIIEIHRPGAAVVEKQYTLESSGNRSHIILRTANSSTEQEFWVAKRRIDDMPEEENRAATDQGGRITDAEVVLAFPIDDQTPIVNDQHVFAFLPVRKAGFKFLIQSDFITQANREDVVHCPWNFRLLDEIVTLFVETISDFSNHGTLKYQWIRYLPIGIVPDEFWALLRRKLLEKLKNTRILFGSRDDTARLPIRLRFVPDHLRDHESEPLIRDCTCDNCVTYVSEGYDRTLDHSILQALGVTNLNQTEFIHRLECDVSLGDQDSLWKSTPMHSAWHEELATVLVQAMDQAPVHKDSLGMIPLIPLSNRGIRWARPRGATIFFPTCRGTDIPTDLNLSLLDPHRLRGPEIKKLYRYLGVHDCPPETVFSEIKRDCQTAVWTRAAAAAHLKFLFWNHDKLAANARPIMVFNSANIKIWPHDNWRGWIYQPHANGEYSAAKAIGQPLPDLLKEKMHFLHPLYYDTLRNCERRQDKTGIQWLEQFLDVRGEPQLRSRGDNGQSSPEFDYIARFRPQYILGLLKSMWPLVRNNASWRSAFRALSVQVPLINSSVKMPLGETYLPLPKLRAVVERLGLEEDFGFIQELQNVNDDDVGQWRFLTEFGVQIEENFTFWINMLKKARETEEITLTAVSEIYSQLQHHCMWSDDNKQALRLLFGVPSRTSNPFGVSSTRSNLFAVSSTPPSQVDYVLSPGGRWVKLNSCVWKAPSWYTYSWSISSQAEYASLQILFTNYLGAPLEPDTATYLDYLTSLPRLPFHSSRTVTVTRIYEVLYSKAEETSAYRSMIVSHFNSSNLVLDADSQTWYGLSNCIWTSREVQLPSKFSLATQYRSLEPFFCGVLKVARPRLDDHIQGLIDVAAGSPTIETVKQMIENICCFRPTPHQVQKLLGCKFLPVVDSNARREWADSEGDFAVVDRREYGKLFAAKARLLDFSLEDVHSFELLFHGLGMQKRYLSQLVESKSTATNREYADTLTRHLRRKAYAFCRYIAHHQMAPVRQTPQQVFRLFETMEVYTTDDISTSLSMRQRGHGLITVTAEFSNVHIEEIGDDFKICVPKDSERRHRSNATELPLALLKHFGATRGSMGNLASIIQTNQLAVIDAILEHAGIIMIDGIERPPDAETHSNTVQDGIDAASPVETTLDEPTRLTPPQHDYPGQRIGLFAVARSQYDPARAIAPPTFSGAQQPGLYRRFLTAVVDGAVSVTGIPRCGQVLSCVVPSAGLIVEDVEFAVADLRKMKIGAAGELFVFEWLKGLQLPGFGLENWRSTIRHYNRAHTDYQNLEAWTGTAETSDIVYKDTEGKLTTLLINRGYLDPIRWAMCQPEYFIEVKATPGALQAPFFVSSDQYGMMEDMRSGAGGRIYMVARVFNIGMAGMGMKLYLDPATLRWQQRLVFKSKTYSVTPVG